MAAGMTTSTGVPTTAAGVAASTTARVSTAATGSVSATTSVAGRSTGAAIRRPRSTVARSTMAAPWIAVSVRRATNDRLAHVELWTRTSSSEAVGVATLAIGTRCRAIPIAAGVASFRSIRRSTRHLAARRRSKWTESAAILRRSVLHRPALRLGSRIAVIWARRSIVPGWRSERPISAAVFTLHHRVAILEAAGLPIGYASARALHGSYSTRVASEPSVRAATRRDSTDMALLHRLPQTCGLLLE